MVNARAFKRTCYMILYALPIAQIDIYIYNVLDIFMMNFELNTF